MLTSNLLGLLAGLTIFAGQAFASPILARQDAAEGVVIGHDIQGMSRPVLTVLRPVELGPQGQVSSPVSTLFIVVSPF
jgi:hypothetical protein